MSCLKHQMQAKDEALAKATGAAAVGHLSLVSKVVEKRRYRLAPITKEVWVYLDRGQLTDPVVVETAPGKVVWVPRDIFETLYERVY